MGGWGWGGGVSTPAVDKNKCDESRCCAKGKLISRAKCVSFTAGIKTTPSLVIISTTDTNYKKKAFCRDL